MVQKLPGQDFQVVQAGDAKLYDVQPFGKTHQAVLVNNSAEALKETGLFDPTIETKPSGKLKKKNKQKTTGLASSNAKTSDADQAEVAETASAALASVPSVNLTNVRLALGVFADGCARSAPSDDDHVFFVDQSNYRKYFPPLLWPIYDGLSTIRQSQPQEQKSKSKSNSKKKQMEQADTAMQLDVSELVKTGGSQKQPTRSKRTNK
ncbi:hypothetical protein CAOG_01748 [Capsaspora owczarzaki ATCC 30864]|uniref:Uncharacterized protein n=1 Tax=Capsaspora owczarzaki (strain ATCC 30864) TaxID=595528 RepID=A0A0D2U5K9_CAPO3|nr:hypothetical protein CAOG_01748 [Capsaspora owczarzaki ATCC 30864]KJE90436.1 hypothetical protein CAOG_001748 [Capsaspora owczarzaki ATCC 30864]|eukprot:XP_004364616.1 hypothetical protein CAOG_01748 [Capsaspora owczarzaki ATCC 30864]